MTRKRYKKLLMSLGIQRDQAETFARLAAYLQDPYETAWAELCEVMYGEVDA